MHIHIYVHTYIIYVRMCVSECVQKRECSEHTQEARAAQLQRLSAVVRRNALEQGLPQKTKSS